MERVGLPHRLRTDDARVGAVNSLDMSPDMGASFFWPGFTAGVHNMLGVARLVLGLSLALGPAAGFLNVGSMPSVCSSKLHSLRPGRLLPGVSTLSVVSRRARSSASSATEKTMSSSRRFEFVPYGEAYRGSSGEKTICADGLVQGADLHLTHWTNNKTPPVLPSTHTVTPCAPAGAGRRPR